jgi:hypothetical protein
VGKKSDGIGVEAMIKRTIAAAVIAAFPAVGHAEKWEKSVTLYGWLPGLDTTIGTAFGDFEPSPSGSDVLSDLDMAFMGVFEAGKGRWRFIKDIIYVDLSDTKTTPFGALFADGTVEVKVWAVSGYIAYRFAESDRATYEVAAGVRYLDLDTTLSLSAGMLPAQSRSLSDSWVDPVIGLRGNWVFSDKWSTTALVDYGGFLETSQTWQVVGTVNYQINEKLFARFGYRHMDVSKTIDGTNIDLAISGPILGLSYRF